MILQKSVSPIAFEVKKKESHAFSGLSDRGSARSPKNAEPNRIKQFKQNYISPYKRKALKKQPRASSKSSDTGNDFAKKNIEKCLDCKKCSA